MSDITIRLFFPFIEKYLHLFHTITIITAKSIAKSTSTDTNRVSETTDSGLPKMIVYRSQGVGRPSKTSKMFDPTSLIFYFKRNVQTPNVARFLYF